MTTNEIMQNAYKTMSNEEKAKVWPPITRKNFVVRDSWMGRNQQITFTNNKNQVVTYCHDTILTEMLPKLQLQACWIKRKYWSQSTNLPSNVRHLATITESTEKQALVFKKLNVHGETCIAPRIAFSVCIAFRVNAAELGRSSSKNFADGARSLIDNISE